MDVTPRMKWDDGKKQLNLSSSQPPANQPTSSLPLGFHHHPGFSLWSVGSRMWIAGVCDVTVMKRHWWGKRKGYGCDKESEINVNARLMRVGICRCGCGCCCCCCFLQQTKGNKKQYWRGRELEPGRWCGPRESGQVLLWLCFVYGMEVDEKQKN